MNTNTGHRGHEMRESKPYYGKRPASLYEVTGRIEDVNTLLVAIHDWPELRNQYLPSIQVLVRGFEINIQRGKGGVVNLVARAHQQHASLWGRIRQNLANALFRAGDLCNPGNHNGPVQVVEGAMAGHAIDDGLPNGRNRNAVETCPIHLADGDANYQPFIVHEGVKQHGDGWSVLRKWVRLWRKEGADDSQNDLLKVDWRKSGIDPLHVQILPCEKEKSSPLGGAAA